MLNFTGLLVLWGLGKLMAVEDGLHAPDIWEAAELPRSSLRWWGGDTPSPLPFLFATTRLSKNTRQKLAAVLSACGSLVVEGFPLTRRPVWLCQGSLSPPEESGRWSPGERPIVKKTSLVASGRSPLLPSPHEAFLVIFSDGFVVAHPQVVQLIKA